MRLGGGRGPRRHGTQGIAATALAIALALLCLAEPASAKRPLNTGVTNVYSRSPLAFDRARASGARFIRIPLYWGGTAPRTLPAAWDPTNPADPAYTWGEGDGDVTQAVRAGLTPVLQIDGTPEWAQRCEPPPLPGPALCNPDPAALGAFAIAAARRYSGSFDGLPRVQYWQPLNEPNLSLFFYPQFDAGGGTVSPHLYRDLVNSFYAGVKAVDPANLVLAAGLAPNTVPNATIGPMRFTRDLLCMRSNVKPRAGGCGGGVRFDIYAIHPYTTGGPSRTGRPDDVQIGGLAKLRNLLRAAERAGHVKGAFKHTPLWITEFSWDSNPPDPGGLPTHIITRWTAEAMHAAWRAGVSHFFWYSLRDSEHNPDRAFSETVESGLYLRGATIEHDQPKPILAVFRFPFVAHPQERGLGFWGRTPSSRPGKVVIQVRRGNRWRRLTVARADRNGIFRGIAPTAYGQGRKRAGTARALFGKTVSAPFSMRPIPDFHHPPFGR